MAIEKVTSNFLSHEPEIPLYSRFLNDTLNGIKDIGALGLYVYLGSKPEDWEIIDAQLMAHFGKGRDAIKNAFKYLKSLGLIKKEPIKDNKGRITGWTTNLKRQITEIPYCGDKSKLIEHSVVESTLLKNQTLDFPDAGESAPTNNIYIQIKEKELEIIETPIVDSSKSTIEKNSVSKKQKKILWEKDERFMRFYKAYPRHEKPADAFKAFKQVVGDDDELLEKIIVDIGERRKYHTQWADKQYIQLPASYLRSHTFAGDIYNANQEAEKKLAEKKQANEKRLAQQDALTLKNAEHERNKHTQANKDGKAFRDISAKAIKPPPEIFKQLAQSIGAKHESK